MEFLFVRMGIFSVYLLVLYFVLDKSSNICIINDDLHFTERTGLEGTSRSHLISPPCSMQGPA